MLYSVYAFPNIILPAVGAIMIFKCGIRINYLLCGFLLILGQSTLALGCEVKSIFLMLGGRAIFGLGGECFGLCHNALLAKWFSKSEIGLSLAISISIGRVGSILNSILTPKIANSTNVSFSLWVGLAVCIGSYICIVAVCIIDKWYKVPNNEHTPDTCESSLFLENQHSDLFWMAIVLSLFFYGVMSSFNNIASGFLLETWFKDEKMPKDIALERAGMYMSIPFFLSLILIPVNGKWIDKYGKRTYLLILSVVISITSFVLFYFINPLISFFLNGISYSIFASTIWACIFMIVHKEQISYALGISYSLQNLSLMLGPMLFAYMFSLSRSYYVSMLLFILLLAVAFIVSILLFLEDERLGGLLRQTAKEGDPFREGDIMLKPYSEEKKTSFISNSIISFRDDFHPMSFA